MTDGDSSSSGDVTGAAPSGGATPPPYGAPPPAPSYAPPAGYGYAAPTAPPYDAEPPQAPPQYAPPLYGASPGYPYAAGPAYGYSGVKTNVLAVVSMVASIVGFLWLLPFFGPLTGVITGHISLRQISRTGEKGRGMALAGVIVGYAGLAVILGIAFLVTISIIATSSYR